MKASSVLSCWIPPPPPHTLFIFFLPLSLYILILTAVWITDLIICGQSNRIGFIFRKEYKMGQIELLWYLGLGAIWGLTTSISWDTLQSDHGGATQIDKKKLQFVIQWKDQRHSEMFYTVIQYMFAFKIKRPSSTKHSKHRS